MQHKRTFTPAPRVTLSRRDALTAAGAFAAGIALVGREAMAQATLASGSDASSAATLPTTRGASDAGGAYRPVVTPNGWALPYRFVDGVKVFHLVAEEVDHTFAPGLTAKCWGYNGSVHGPTIEAVEGDRVRVFVTNKLTAPTTVHWHGLLVPSGMDGVGGLNQRAIAPGETFRYEFTLRQHGTLMYHAHHDEMTQIGMGMTGMFIIHPRTPEPNPPDRDFAIMLHEWAIEVGTNRPNPNEMTDFNVLTMNGKAFPGTAPLVVKQGERVRIRFGNLGPMDHHPIHLHGYQFTLTATDGGDVPPSARHPDTTVLVAVGQTRTIEFVADYPGDWAMHCHMTHHVMNQMGHEFPNLIGMKPQGVDEQIKPLLPGYMTMGHDGMLDMGMKVPPNSIPMVGGDGPHDVITMGGMFTILKVRADLPQGHDVDPGWYTSPPAEQADLASADVLRANHIDATGTDAPRPAHATTQPAGIAAPHHAPQSTAEKATSQPAATIYTCPMDPEVVSDQPGRCPKCGMKLVAK